MAGLLKPVGGELRTAPVSMVFLEPRLLPWKTALENTALPLAEKTGKKEAEEKALHFLRLVSVEHKAASLPGELSGGEQQRVNLARAFACPTEILLMDEPFQSLDIPLRIQLMDLSLSLLEDFPHLAVIVSHDPREAVYMGKRILVLGQAPQGIIHDEVLNLSREERRYGSPVQRIMEEKLIARLLSA
jgi:NitT/TauT family transport system ATP-binding protein